MAGSTTTRAALALLVAATLVGGEASAQVIYARLSGGHFAYIDPATANVRIVAEGVLATQAMTFDSDARVLYGVNLSPPHLVRVDLARGGRPDTVGVVYDAVPGDIRRAEAIAYNPCDGKLYASVSAGDDYVSELLVTLDAATGRITSKQAYAHMFENDGDALEFVGCQLYAVDVGTAPSYFYRMAGADGTCIGVCSGGGSLGLDYCNDLVYCPGEGGLIGAAPLALTMGQIDVATGTSTLIGSTLLGVRSLAFDPLGPDCDGDGQNDDDQIAANQALDWNGDGVLDRCQPATSAVPAVADVGFVLRPSRPNPFNPATVLAFELEEAARVRLEVFDGSGRRVCRLLEDVALGPGAHEVIWRGRNDAGWRVAAGVYFCRLSVGGVGRTGKMVLVN